MAEIHAVIKLSIQPEPFFEVGELFFALFRDQIFGHEGTVGLVHAAGLIRLIDLGLDDAVQWRADFHLIELLVIVTCEEFLVQLAIIVIRILQNRPDIAVIAPETADQVDDPILFLLQFFRIYVAGLDVIRCLPLFLIELAISRFHRHKRQGSATTLVLKLLEFFLQRRFHRLDVLYVRVGLRAVI